jgi:pimeloyl-ACP methyl ester carboxylesterase
VIWGASDGIVGPDYGRAYAAAIPGATFTLLPEAGHLPQLEAPERLAAELGRADAGRAAEHPGEMGGVAEPAAAGDRADRQ